MTVTERDSHEMELFMAMTDAERQKKRRAALKNAQQEPLLVRGKNGEFDERIRIALAIQTLAQEHKLSDEIIDLIAEASENSFPTPELSKRKFINKIVKEFLKK